MATTPIRSSSQLWIDASLDFKTQKGVNLLAGTVAGDAVEFSQMNTAISNAVSGVGNTIHVPVADLTAAKAVVLSERADRMIMLIETLGLYRYDTEMIAASNDGTIIRPTDIATDAAAGRWIKISTTISDHDNLSNILGNGTYHLSLAERDKLTGIAANANNYVHPNHSGEATSVADGAITLVNSAVIGKVLTGFVAGAGTVTATDSIFSAIQKLAANHATNANLSGPITSVGNVTSVALQTGTGSRFVMDTSPTLVTPNIGTATATRINGLAITAAAAMTLTILNGKTLTVNNSILLSGTDGTVMTFPTTSATIARTDAGQTFTGVNVFTSPSLTTPTITGIATGTGVSASATANTLLLRDVNANSFSNNSIEGYATTVTAAGITTLSASSAYNQFFTGATTQTVTLPVVTTLTLGHQFVIVNNSTGAVTIQSSGANAVQIVSPGGTAKVTCILTSGTSQTSWNVIYDTLAASTNTANTSVLRDASGNFSAGSITATLLGTANNVVTNANLTGPVTSVGNATSITANAVTLAHMAQVATGTFLGRTTAATGNVEAMTVAQAKALLGLSGQATQTRTYRASFSTGVVNGSTTVFTIASLVANGTEEIFKNGILMNAGAGNDYTIAYNTPAGQTTVTFATAPSSAGFTDVLLVNYSV
jgi:hypothetical protein